MTLSQRATSNRHHRNLACGKEADITMLLRQIKSTSIYYSVTCHRLCTVAALLAQYWEAIDPSSRHDFSSKPFRTEYSVRSHESLQTLI
jgi:hypothetical protein